MNIVGLNAKELERGLVCSPGGLKRMRGAIVEVERVRFVVVVVVASFYCGSHFCFPCSNNHHDPLPQQHQKQ